MRTRREAFQLLEDVMAAGIQHFDTARLYGRGFSEKLLGEFFRTDGSGLQVTTKAGLGPRGTAPVPTWLALPVNHTLSTHRRRRRATASYKDDSEPRMVNLHRESITRDVLEASLAESLRQLGRQRVEILLLHEALPEQLSSGAWEFLVSSKAAGIVGRIGMGTNRDALERGYDGDPRIEVLQYEGTSGIRPPLMDRFPEALHIHHSIFRGTSAGTHSDVLRRALQNNPAGRVIFSTSSRRHLRENLRSLE